MLEFKPRLKVMRGGINVAFLTLPSHIGHVLPRVGEIVILNREEADPDHLLEIDAADAPVVTAVWHFVGTDPKPEYVVEIEVRTFAGDGTLAASFHHTGRGGWVPVTPETP